MITGPQKKGGAGGRPTLDKQHHTQTHLNRPANRAQQWRVVVSTRDAVWGRFSSQHEADAEAGKLMERGFYAWVEGDA